MFVAVVAGCQRVEYALENLVTHMVLRYVYLHLSLGKGRVDDAAVHGLPHHDRSVFHNQVGPEPQTNDSVGVQAASATRIARSGIEPLRLDVSLAYPNPAKLDALVTDQLSQVLDDLFWFACNSVGYGFGEWTKSRSHTSRTTCGAIRSSTSRSVSACRTNPNLPCSR